MLRESTSLPKKSDADERTHLTLVSKYQPAGDQETAIAGLVEGLKDGLARQTLLGVTGSGKTFTMASVIASAAGDHSCAQQDARGAALRRDA